MSNSSDIMVSICCTVFNHEKYLRKCLDGFVEQKTNFKYEVLIHDDASTDSSADIIREYEAKYPDMIKPIYQTENQYSKGISISKTYQYPRVNGKYIALCEGDDYWINENKLQLQYDYMEANNTCTAYVHNAILYLVEHNRKTAMLRYKKEKEFFLDDFLNMRNWFPTSSFFVRKDIIINNPEEIKLNDRGDFPIMLNAALQGYIHYSPQIMSVYNYGTNGSWTNRQKTLDLIKQAEICRDFRSIYINADKLSSYKYHSCFLKKVLKQEYLYYRILNNKKRFSYKYFEFLVEDIIKAPFVKTKKLLRRLCEKISVNSKTVIKTLCCERLDNSRSDFFTVYNGHCNLSRFCGYQPDGIKRSGMESG